MFIQLSSEELRYRMKDAFTSISYVSIAKFSYTAKYNFLYRKGLPCLSHSHPFALSPFFLWDVVAQQGSAFHLQLSSGTHGLRRKLSAW